MLQIQNLCKKYSSGKKTLSVIENLSFEIPQGSFVTIQGASGSGKSTLLYLLGGLEKADSGEIFWKNSSLQKMSTQELSRWRNESVGFVFQSYQLLNELSALENVEIPALIAQKPDLDRSMQLLQEVGLGDRSEHRPLELSGGEQQRVAIARALRNSPSLLLADEPTGNLDSETAKEVLKLLLQVHREKKMTLVLVTHDRAIAQQGEIQFFIQ